MNPPDPSLLTEIERSLARGLELKRWQEATGGSAACQRFYPVTTFNRPDTAFSFFDSAPFTPGGYPVMGDVKDLLYDRPKYDGARAAAAQWMCRQIREFALVYALRVMDTRRPEVLPEPAADPSPLLLRPFSWCPPATVQRQGFGYSQLYYKLRDGRAGSFPPAERSAILDLREVRERYRWIAMSVRIFDFDLEFSPFGPELPSVRIPMRKEQLVVISPDFIVDRDRPAPGVLGEYGFGYAIVREPEQGLLSYGPGHFEAGYALLHFRVLEDGEARLREVFTVNRPYRLLNVSSLSPIFSSIALVNLLSAGMAKRWLCISREQIEKDMLIKHFLQTYGSVAELIVTWRQVANWLDRAALPAWALTGISS